MVKFVGMSGVFQVKCPVCIAVDAPGAIPQMQLRCRIWSRRCSSAFAVVAWSKKICREIGRSCVGVSPSNEAALHNIAFIFGSSFEVPFLDDVLLERLLAQVAVRLSIECDSAEVSTVSGLIKVAGPW
eukprot:300206-Ditylum_brightwellii.AAC.1